MDFATLIGLIAAFALVALAVLLGGDATAFFNVRAALIVIGGTFAVTLISFRMPEMSGAFSAAWRTLKVSGTSDVSTTENLLHMADAHRKEGIRGVERHLPKIRQNAFVKQALSLIIDGINPDEVEQMLNSELAARAQKDARSAQVLRRAAEVAPAMGLIGTLVGLVQMLADLNDPTQIAPAMAVALITTFYGAILGNMLLAPLASKIERNSQEENAKLFLYATSVAAIGRQESPRRLQMVLNSMLPPAEQVRLYN